MHERTVQREGIDYTTPWAKQVKQYFPTTTLCQNKVQLFPVASVPSLRVGGGGLLFFSRFDVARKIKRRPTKKLQK
jgi:hypothetical protein